MSQPTTLDDLSQHALALQRAGKPLEAAQAYINIVRQVADHWPSYYNLGLVFQELKRIDDARVAYERAVQFNPQLAQGWNNLGIVLQALKRDDQAITAYQRAIAIDPSLAQARYNIAIVQQSRGRFTDSTESLRLAVAANPKDDNAWDALYRALLALKRQEDAVQAFIDWEAALGQSPLLTAAGLAQSRFLGDRVREAAYLKLAIDWPFPDPRPEQLIPILGMIQYFDVDGASLLRCYQRFDAAVAATHPLPIAPLPRRSAGQKIRVGYVSADFRRHVMGQIMLDVLRAHDRERFSIHLISTAESRYLDATTEEFKKLSDAFVDASNMTDLDAARAIAEFDLDVLVDLAGQTMGGRPIIYAHRPARKIVTHLGYHGSLGLSAVDYKLTDRLADPPEAAEFQIEKPFYLDSCLFPFAHVESSAEEERHYMGQRREGEFVFGTFVNVLKLSARCVVTWAKILQAAPNAVLAFSPLTSDDEPSIRRATSAAGIDPSRLRFIASHTSVGGQRARHALIDAVLDTFPYAGGDTTLAALDRDVPVITLTGKRNAERVGVSLLTHLGVTDTICTTEAEYIACAVRMASDRDWHQAMRTRFKSARERSSFAKVATHARALELAYVTIAAESTLENSSLSAKKFFQRFSETVRAHQRAQQSDQLGQIDMQYAALEAEQPGYVPLLRLRAAVAKSNNDGVREQELLAKAHATLPSDPSVAVALADALMDAGAYGDAAQVLKMSLALSPNDDNLQIAQARLYLRLARTAEAHDAATTVVNRAPTNVDARLLQANALAELGRVAEAFASYGQVLSLAPNHLGANYNAGLLALEGGAAASAEPLLRKAVEIDSRHELAHLRLAEALQAQHKTEAWIGLAKRLAAEFPRSLAARLTRAEAWRYEGELARESAEIVQVAEALVAEPDHHLVEETAARILRRRTAVGLSDALVDALKFRHAAAVQALHGVAAPSLPSRADALRIGMLIETGDTRNGIDDHRLQLTNAFAAAFTNAGCSAQIYLLDRPTSEASHPSTVSLAGMSAAAAAARVRADAIDVLFDGVGYRHHLAPAILAQCPARLAIANGAFASVYDEPQHIDFDAFDEWTALPQWKVRGPTRAIMRLQALLPTIARTQAARAEADGAHPIIFAISARIDEIPLAAIALWQQVLVAVPNSKLAVPAFDDVELRTYVRVLRAAGVGASRIVSWPNTPPDKRFQGIGAILDTLGCSTAITTSEALDNGCPVISMRGATAAERMSYAVLARRDLAELAADSAKDYLRLAVRFAQDSIWRDALRSRLSQRSAPRITGADDVATLRAALNSIT